MWEEWEKDTTPDIATDLLNGEPLEIWTEYEGLVDDVFTFYETVKRKHTGEVVIQEKMRDGSFIVRGLGNKDALCSSSHGAGRAMSRNEARKNITFKELNENMCGILTNHTENNIDEAPRAYKDIFEVMKAQSDLK